MLSTYIVLLLIQFSSKAKHPLPPPLPPLAVGVINTCQAIPGSVPLEMLTRVQLLGELVSRSFCVVYTVTSPFLPPSPPPYSRHYRMTHRDASEAAMTARSCRENRHEERILYRDPEMFFFFCVKNSLIHEHI